MVWFHGGGFTSGNGSSRAYEGVRLARRGDVVVVTSRGFAGLGLQGGGLCVRDEVALKRRRWLLTRLKRLRGGS